MVADEIHTTNEDDGFKLEVVQRLARIETKLDGYKDRIDINRKLIYMLFGGIASLGAILVTTGAF